MEHILSLTYSVNTVLVQQRIQIMQITIKLTIHILEIYDLFSNETYLNRFSLSFLRRLGCRLKYGNYREDAIPNKNVWWSLLCQILCQKNCLKYFYNETEDVAPLIQYFINYPCSFVLKRTLPQYIVLGHTVQLDSTIPNFSYCSTHCLPTAF